MREDRQRPDDQDPDGDTDAGRADNASDPNREIPDDVVSEAERLTRLAANAAVEAEAEVYRDRRAEVAGDYDFVPRVREADDTLVLYPEEWVDDGVVQFDRIEDTDRAVEVSLSGPDHSAEWEAVEADNEAIVTAVAEEHGPTHAANVRAFADFMGNHYLKRVGDATETEKEAFLTEYYPRNAWPSAEQRAVVEDSVELATDAADSV
ncbi:hypothetical protein GCM10008995_19250 [Halobellus salinus]|uniref:RnhA operon protein n=1 Tax=Halobellus salinus TaxID=931585 RepID=A0A830ENY2_9EURY|nr:rnhA operon protein [Halobellus salinus]GGJ09536.1 hypothetical protein GCM10008995_19250 [Halobellus salinus]SMP27517.1 hypothetical protein SAMN06265347_112100 [Halobellus salinus]